MLRSEVAELKELIKESMLKNVSTNVLAGVTTEPPNQPTPEPPQQSTPEPPQQPTPEPSQQPTLDVSLGSSFGSHQSLNLDECSEIISVSEISEAEIAERIQKLRTIEEPTSAHPVLFNGRDHPLSNCYEHAWCSKACTIKCKGRNLKTAENAWAWFFLECHGLPEDAQVAAEADPFAAKGMCKRVKNKNPEWLDQRTKYMAEVLDAKFDACDGFRTFLLESKGALVENTRDPFWGGIPSFNGLNTLGQLLMQKRANGNREASRTFVSNAKAAPKQLQKDPEKRIRQVCHKCGEKNHSTKKCRHEFRIKCNSCNEKGHKAKMCPSEKHHKQGRSITTPEKTYIGPPDRKGTLGKMTQGRHHHNWKPHQWGAKVNQAPNPSRPYHQNQNEHINAWQVQEKRSTTYPVTTQDYQNYQTNPWHCTKTEPTPPYPPTECYNMYSVLQPVTEANPSAYQWA